MGEYEPPSVGEGAAKVRPGRGLHPVRSPPGLSLRAAAGVTTGAILEAVWKRLGERLRERRAERQARIAAARRRLRAGELPPDGDTADRNVIGGALSQRPYRR